MRRPAFILLFLLLTITLSLGISLAQDLGSTGVRVVTDRDGVNIRLYPAIGSEVLGFAPAGTVFAAQARSPDNEWVRVDFNLEQAWIGTAVLAVIEGDFATLPVADPRSIPYGGFESPRAGSTSAIGPVQGKLEDSGVRVRSGPGRAYPVLANAPRFTIFEILGRTRNNNWFQVNYEGTLGWVAAFTVTLQAEFDIRTLPVDGIVAENTLNVSGDEDEYFALLRLMLERLDLAQPSLDQSRAIWTNIALGGRSSCADFPAKPTGINIPNPLLARFFNELEPLRVLFNDAMANVRLSIDLYLESCGFAQPPEGSVGQGTVQGALSAVNLADAQFTELRARIRELLPPEGELGPNECLLEFGGRTAILQVLQVNVVYLDRLVDQAIAGYCIDLVGGVQYEVGSARVSGDVALFQTVSPLDNPTNFVAISGGTPGGIADVIFTAPASGRYLFIVANLFATTPVPVEGGAAPQNNDIIVLYADNAAAINNEVVIDLDTGQTVQNPFQTFLTPEAGEVLQPTIVDDPGLGQTVATAVPNFTPSASQCPSLSFTCSQLFTCEEAQACYNEGNFTLDADGDGIPCEENLCLGGN